MRLAIFLHELENVSVQVPVATKKYPRKIYDALYKIIKFDKPKQLYDYLSNLTRCFLEVNTYQNDRYACTDMLSALEYINSHYQESPKNCQLSKFQK